MTAPFVVVGGGPAGAVAAARLAQLGERVIVLEKDEFPRFRIGESLLPQSMHSVPSMIQTSQPTQWPSLQLQELHPVLLRSGRTTGLTPQATT